MRYTVHTVGDDELPEGVDWLVVERDNAPPVMLVSRGPARVWAAMRAWEDTMEPPSVPSLFCAAPHVPVQRQPDLRRLVS